MMFTSDVDAMADTFCKLTMFLLDKHAPQKPWKVHTDSVHWLNDTVKRSLIERDPAKRVWKSIRTPAAHNHYKILRNRATQIVKSAKSSFYCAKFNSKLTSQKLFRELRHLGMSKDNKSPLFKVDEYNAFKGQNKTYT